jgi:IS30 family transposase
MGETGRQELWQRYRRGETYAAIGDALGCDEAAVYYVLRQRGGYSAPVRRRAARTLSLSEREQISRGLARHASFHQLARTLQRAPSTISREVQRHGGRTAYRATVADRRAWRRAQRPKRCRLAQHAALRTVVARQLAAKWSPQQIAGWLRRTYPDNPAMHVSHETIYRSLFVQSRGVLKRALMAELRRPRLIRRARSRAPWSRVRIHGAISIRERPAAAEDRAVPGHWEGDLLAGAQHTHIATLVERRSRYVLLVRLPAGDSATVTEALARRIRTLPASLRQSLTWDRGTELAAHAAFTVATDVRVYFCDPQSPWQRGSNENTNGLLRQYLPRGTNLSTYSQAQLNTIARQLNTRPRKTLAYQTPAEVFAAGVAATV